MIRNCFGKAFRKQIRSKTKTKTLKTEFYAGEQKVSIKKAKFCSNTIFSFCF